MNIMKIHAGDHIVRITLWTKLGVNWFTEGASWHYKHVK